MIAIAITSPLRLSRRRWLSCFMSFCKRWIMALFGWVLTRNSNLENNEMRDKLSSSLFIVSPVDDLMFVITYVLHDESWFYTTLIVKSVSVVSSVLYNSIKFIVSYVVSTDGSYTLSKLISRDKCASWWNHWKLNIYGRITVRATLLSCSCYFVSSGAV